MSHFTKLKTKFKDMDALQKALADAGYQWRAGPTSIRGWQGQSRKVDLAVDIPGISFGIGFIAHKDRDKELELVADWYGLPNLSQTAFVESLIQRYSYHCVKSQLETQGFKLDTEELAKGGAIQLTLRRSV